MSPLQEFFQGEEPDHDCRDPASPGSTGSSRQSAGASAPGPLRPPLRSRRHHGPYRLRRSSSSACRVASLEQSPPPVPAPRRRSPPRAGPQARFVCPNSRQHRRGDSSDPATLVSAAASRILRRTLRTSVPVLPCETAFRSSSSSRTCWWRSAMPRTDARVPRGSCPRETKRTHRLGPGRAFPPLPCRTRRPRHRLHHCRSRTRRTARRSRAPAEPGFPVPGTPGTPARPRTACLQAPSKGQVHVERRPPPASRSTRVA